MFLLVKQVKKNRRKRKQKSVNNKKKSELIKNIKLKELKDYCFKDGEELTETECELFFNNHEVKFR